MECGSLRRLFGPLKAVPGHRTPKALPWAQRPVNIVLSFSSSEASNGLALATLLTAAAVLLLGLAVVARARASLVSLLFFGVTIAAAGWLAGFSAIYESPTPARALWWARVSSVFACLLPAAIFHFTAVYVGRRRDLRMATLFCWIFCAAIALTGATTPLGVWRYSWGYYPRGSLSNLWLVAVFAGILAASIRLLWRASHDSEGQSRQGARAAPRALACLSIRQKGEAVAASPLSTWALR